MVTDAMVDPNIEDLAALPEQDESSQQMEIDDPVPPPLDPAAPAAGPETEQEHGNKNKVGSFTHVLNDELIKIRRNTISEGILKNVAPMERLQCVSW